ncbi:hypothetical protein BdWA1_002681 [Babesia duncani]|uniref:Uncharacterized protein n=1 Tax=Babesia duncani TaxID=323732 RepID=A0AAD9PJP5_9APIC|nr:hypothetical protein BdWA1_002681 [Babesia duncani]
MANADPQSHDFPSFHLDLDQILPASGDIQIDSDTGNVIISTDSERLEISSRCIDVTVMRNILFCYHFLNTTDRDYVNSSEAKYVIERMQEENPELYNILCNVMKVTFEYPGDTSDVWKNDFIIRLREYISTIQQDVTSPLSCLKLTENPIIQYFENLDKACRKEANGDHSKTSLEDDDEKECTFKPKINRYTLGPDVINKREEITNMQHLGNVLNRQHEHSLFNEYIIFNLNSSENWNETLRELDTCK